MQEDNCVGTETCYIFCFPLQVSTVKFLVYRKLEWKFLDRIRFSLSTDKGFQFQKPFEMSLLMPQESDDKMICISL